MTAAVRVKGTQGTPEWLDNRRDVVGSSDIAVITRDSPYSTSVVDLWAVKTRLLEPAPPDEDQVELFALGTALEPVIAERYMERTGRRVRRVRDQLRHPIRTWVGASLDRVLVGERRIVEVKWAPNRRWTEGEDGVPPHVSQQVQWQMLVTGFRLADVAVLNGSRLEIHTIEEDPAYQAALVDIAWHDLWRYVESGDMPPIDGAESTRRTLGRLNQAANDVVLDARYLPDIDAMARELRALQLAEKAATGAVGSQKNALAKLLLDGEATAASGDGWRLTWNQNQPSRRTAWEAVAGAFRTLLADVPPERLDAIESLHTEARDGARPMRLWWKDEETGRWV